MWLAMTALVINQKQPKWGAIFDAANRTLPAPEIGNLYSKCDLEPYPPLR